MIPFKVTSRDIPLSDSMHSEVERHIDALERFADHIVHCEVILSRPHGHQKKTRMHHVRIQIKMARKSFVIDREPEKNMRHTSFKLALSDAFKLVERKLEGDFKKARAVSKTRRTRAGRRTNGGAAVALDETED